MSRQSPISISGIRLCLIYALGLIRTRPRLPIRPRLSSLMDSQLVSLLRWILPNTLGYQVIARQPTMPSSFTIGIVQQRIM